MCHDPDRRGRTFCRRIKTLLALNLQEPDWRVTQCLSAATNCPAPNRPKNKWWTLVRKIEKLETLLSYKLPWSDRSSIPTFAPSEEVQVQVQVHHVLVGGDAMGCGEGTNAPSENLGCINRSLPTCRTISTFVIHARTPASCFQ